MVVNTTPARKRTSKARVFAAVTLATCLGAGGAALGAAPAFAGGNGPWYGGTATILKVDGTTQTPLAGATLTVCSPESTIEEQFDFTGADLQTQRDRYQEVADGASFESYQARLAENIPYYAEQVAAAEAAMLDAGTLASHQQAIADYDAAASAASAALVASDAAHAEWQAGVAEILALQNAGNPVPVELAEQEAALQVASTDANAATAAANATRDALQGARDAAITAIAAHNSAQMNYNIYKPLADAAQAAYDNAASTWDSARYDNFTELARQMQVMIDVHGNITPVVVDGEVCYTATTDETGTLYIPISLDGYGYSIEEVVAPAGYERVEGKVVVTVESGTVNTGDGSIEVTYSQTSDNVAVTPNGDATFGGGSHLSGGSNLGSTLSNTPVTPPVDPPVDPPVEPPVEPPVTPPTTPETPKTPEAELAYTGSDAAATWTIGGIAAALLAAGGALFAFRRRTASE